MLLGGAQSLRGGAGTGRRGRFHRSPHRRPGRNARPAHRRAREHESRTIRNGDCRSDGGRAGSGCRAQPVVRASSSRMASTLSVTRWRMPPISRASLPVWSRTSHCAMRSALPLAGLPSGDSRPVAWPTSSGRCTPNDLDCTVHRDLRALLRRGASLARWRDLHGTRRRLRLRHRPRQHPGRRVASLLRFRSHRALQRTALQAPAGLAGHAIGGIAPLDLFPDGVADPAVPDDAPGLPDPDRRSARQHLPDSVHRPRCAPHR